jgi:hypothetical protein
LAKDERTLKGKSMFNTIIIFFFIKRHLYLQSKKEEKAQRGFNGPLFHFGVARVTR